MRAAREKLLAVPRPIAGIRSPVDGMALMLCKLTATQSKTYLGRASKAPGEAYIRKHLSAGAAAYITAVHETAEVAAVLNKVFEDEARRL